MNTFKYFGLQTIVESVIRSQEIKVFTRTMRQLVCMMDEWDGLTMTDIRRMEEEAKKKLDEMIKSQEKKEMFVWKLDVISRMLEAAKENKN